MISVYRGVNSEAPPARHGHKERHRRHVHVHFMPSSKRRPESRQEEEGQGRHGEGEVGGGEGEAMRMNGAWSQHRLCKERARRLWRITLPALLLNTHGWGRLAVKDFAKCLRMKYGTVERGEGGGGGGVKRKTRSDLVRFVFGYSVLPAGSGRQGEAVMTVFIWMGQEPVLTHHIRSQSSHTTSGASPHTPHQEPVLTHHIRSQSSQTTMGLG